MRNNVAINRPDKGRTVAGSINELFQSIREQMRSEPSVSIATAYINPAGYALLADELNAMPRVRLLIGAEPEFEADRAKSSNDKDADKAIGEALTSHEAWLAAERDLSGFTLEALSAAKSMVDWLESVDSSGAPKVEIRRFTKGFLHGKTFMIKSGRTEAAVSGSSNFTYAGLSQNAELNLATEGTPGHVQEISEWFDYYWEQSEEYDLAALFKSQWLPHEPWPVFVRMLQELYGDDVFAEETPSGRLGLTNFQRDGVTRMKRLVKENGGVLVADEVGLGKSYLAAEMILQATEENRQRAVVIAPAAIKAGMWDPFLDKSGFKRNVKVYSYEEVRNKMEEPEAPSADADPREFARYQKAREAWLEFQAEAEDFALIVIDEAHNLRNAGAQRSDAVDRMILSGKRPKQVVLLTATPVNNSLTDLETLVKYFVRDDARFASVGIPSIREYIKRASDMDPENLSPEHLFDLMDQIAVRRTRKFVRDNYANDKITLPDGTQETIKFPTPKSHRIDYDLDGDGQKLVSEMLYALSVDVEDESNNDYLNRKDDSRHLMLARYQPSRYRIDNQLERSQIQNVGLLQSALLKRLESSPYALLRSLEKLADAHEAFLQSLEAGWVITGATLAELTNSEAEDFNEVLAELDLEDNKDAHPIGLYHAQELIDDVKSDQTLIGELIALAKKAYAGADLKYNALVESLIDISKVSDRPDLSQAPSRDRRKVIVFSSFADTIDDLHERLTEELKTSQNPALDHFRGRLAPAIYGATTRANKTGASGGVDQEYRATILKHFAPKSTANLAGEEADRIDDYDILLTTDVLAEGVNLQQAGRIINYDLPWNPMRIVQRHGRVDRIGSRHDYVNLSLFFPNQMLDEMLGLEARLQRKLAQAHAAVGEHIEVLAAGRVKTDVILHDKSMKEWDAFLDERGGVNAISGEEFRRRLYKHMLDNPAARSAPALPYGSGSGFVNPKLSRNGYVFCARIGKQAKPWFRFVQADSNWAPLLDADSGAPRISADSLVALTAADPGNEQTKRSLSDEAYSGAFAAWEYAKKDIFEKWTYLADPLNVATKQPKSFRDAQALIVAHGSFLADDLGDQVHARLNAVPAKKVELAVGRIIRDESVSPKIRIERVIEALNEAGIMAPKPTEPVPQVREHEIRLVTWMAVEAGNPSTDPASS